MPKNWKNITMHKLCEITSSKRVYASDYQSDGIPFYRSKEIIEKYNGNIDVSTELFISNANYETFKSKFGAPEEGDLLLTSVGTLGIPYIVKKNEIFYFKDGNLTWFKKFNKLHSQFLYYWLLSPNGKAELKKCTIGSSQSAFTIVLLKDMQIGLPSEALQHTIASILSAYDDLIENNMKRIKILEEMAQMIYREWFVNFRFPGHEKVKMVDSPLGKTPDGWEVKKIGDELETLGGGTPSTKKEEYWVDANVTWYTPSDITKNKMMFIHNPEKKISKLGLQKSSARMFPEYSVMMTSRATIGEFAINTTPACTNQGFITCIPTERLSAYYMLFLLMEMKEKISALAGGATYKEINKTTFRKINIIVPDKKIMDDLTDTLTPMMNIMENLQLRTTNLRKTRDLLLPRLISGELDVEGLDIRI